MNMKISTGKFKAVLRRVDAYTCIRKRCLYEGRYTR